MVSNKRKKRRKGRSKSKNGPNIFVIFGLIISIAALFFLLRYTVLFSNQNAFFKERVLLQLNKYYQIIIEQDKICIEVSKKDRIRNVLIEIEEMINKENGSLTDYAVTREGQYLLLTLFVISHIDEDDCFSIIVKKAYSSKT